MNAIGADVREGRIHQVRMYPMGRCQIAGQRIAGSPAFALAVVIAPLHQGAVDCPLGNQLAEGQQAQGHRDLGRRGGNIQ